MSAPLASQEIFTVPLDSLPDARGAAYPLAPDSGSGGLGRISEVAKHRRASMLAMKQSSRGATTGTPQSVGYVRMRPELKAWAMAEAARRGTSFNLYIENLVEADRARSGSYQSVIDKMGGKL
jgi:hypothetical protein